MSQTPYQKPRLLRLSVKDHTNNKNNRIKESDGPGNEGNKFNAPVEFTTNGTKFGGGAVAPSG
jgi:hypothetical protein